MKKKRKKRRENADNGLSIAKLAIFDFGYVC